MPEAYTGVKFKTVFLEKSIVKNEKIKELVKWCNRFAKLGLSPKYGDGSAGNLSFRTEKGFIITGSRTDFSAIKENEFTEVLECNADKKEVCVIGLKEPSSEAFLHFSVYKERKDVNAVFHVHDNAVLKANLNLPTTEKEQPYGTLELVNEVLKVLDNNNYIVIKNHGVLALGKTIEEAGELAVSKHEEA
jgi:L-fuculose-phosphate aldolase